MQLAITRDWLYDQTCRLSHSIPYHYFIILGDLFELIMKRGLSQDYFTQRKRRRSNDFLHKAKEGFATIFTQRKRRLSNDFYTKERRLSNDSFK